VLDVTIGYIRAQWGRPERGSAIVEYVLLLTLIAVACLLAVSFLGASASSKYTAVAHSVANT
jgi:Flp pilus assembly pilin Flp